MKFSSIDNAFAPYASQLQVIDMETLAGLDASSLMDTLEPHKRLLDAVYYEAGARAIATNQHNADGARSGSAWLAEKTGVSEAEARASLATQKAIEENPALKDAVDNGEISRQQASVISQSPDSGLLELAKNGDTVEELKRRVQEERAKTGDRAALRKRQFVSLHQNDDGLQRLELALLPELAVSIAEAYRKASGATGWERAESFAKLLTESGGSKGPSAVFHLDLSEEFEIKDIAHLKGFGPVPTQAAIDVFERASLSFVGNFNNKLAWFSEEDRKSKTKVLPEFVKRAVRAKAYDTCEKPHCNDVAAEVDHNQARTNGGDNQLFNLQALCEPDHDAKTRKDAPWTAGGIYGKHQGVHRDTG